jgi:exopolysaccharide biosynthesis predicted pyruvyltransferase EpsI
MCRGASRHDAESGEYHVQQAGDAADRARDDATAAQRVAGLSMNSITPMPNIHAEIGALLRDIRGSHNEPYALLQNPGNCGDSVINAATFQCFDRERIAFEEVHPASFRPEGRLVLYPGGGNLINPHTYAVHTLRPIHARCRHLVVLPHTITQVDELLGEFGSNVTLIAREKVTHEYLLSRGGAYRTVLSEDMAFGLDVEWLAARPTALVPFWLPFFYAMNKPTSRRPLPKLKGIWRSFVRRSAPPGLSDFFRVDGESAGKPIPPGNLDISDWFQMGTAPRGLAELGAQRFVRALQDAAAVRTDRLHVAITAGLLGRPVEFHPNNYFKCRAVYEHSMIRRTPSVRWVE